MSSRVNSSIAPITMTATTTPVRPEYKGGFQGNRLFTLLQSPPTRRLRRLVADLLASGEDPKQRGDYGETYLHLLPACVVLGAASETDGTRSPPSVADFDTVVDHVLPVVYQLAAAGVDAIGGVDRDGNTPLHICVVTGAGHRLARALLRVGVDPQRANCRGETAISLASDLLKTDAAATARLVLQVLDEAESGLWSAVVSKGNAQLARRLINCWYRVDLFRQGHTMVSAARRSSSSSAELLQYVDSRAPTVRLVHAALAGDAAAVRESLVVSARRPELPAPDPNARDPGYRFDDASALQPPGGGWPLLAEVIRLGLIDVAGVLVEIGNADVNAQLFTVHCDRPMPLFQWAIEKTLSNSDADDYEQLRSTMRPLIARANWSLIVEPAAFVCDVYRKRRLAATVTSGNPVPDDERPSTSGGASSGVVDEVLAAFVGRRLSLLTCRNADGQTARDLIMLDAIISGGAVENGSSRHRQMATSWQSAVRYVDSIVVDAVRCQAVDTLEELAIDGYDYVIVDEVGSDGKNRSVLQLAQDDKLTASLEFLQRLTEFQKSARRLHAAIVRGNLAEMRRNIDRKLVRVRDKGGRRALHVAVLYERRFIIRELVRDYPEIVNMTDFKNRTALHYAYCLPHGGDIVQCLLDAGADPRMADENEYSPADYDVNVELQQSTLVVERSRRASSTDSLLVERYLSLSDAIRSARRQRIYELCDTLLDGSELDQMSPQSCPLLAELVRRSLVRYRPLLFQCIDNGLEDVAVHMVKTLKADYHIADFQLERRSNDDRPVSLLDAANSRFMYKLVECIRIQMAQDNRNSQPAALTDGFSSQSKCDVVIEDAAADTAHADEEVAFIEDCDKRGSTSTAENISFSVYNLRAPSSAVFDRCGSPSSQGSEAGGDLLKRRSSSPVCLIL